MSRGKHTVITTPPDVVTHAEIQVLCADVNFGSKHALEIFGPGDIYQGFHDSTQLRKNQQTWIPASCNNSPRAQLFVWSVHSAPR